MKISFRVDASLRIGSGHVMRCLTLADALRHRGNECVFLTRPHLGHLTEMIEMRGHKVLALPVAPEASSGSSGEYASWLGVHWQADAEQTITLLANKPLDWLVVDHYAIDHQWEHLLRASCSRLMVIDDLADRTHNCDLLLDQNLGRTAQSYGNLMDSRAVMLTGPGYALLRPEFAEWRRHSLQRRMQPECRAILITMGGMDLGGITAQILSKLCALPLPADMHIVVVSSSQSPQLQLLRSQAAYLPWPTQILVDVNNMAELMAASDLAIGAAGGTAWERCSLGLPSIIIAIADNQKPGASALRDAGAALVANDLKDFSAIMKSVLSIDGLQLLQNLSATSANLTDGEGVSRVVNVMESICV